MFRPIASAICVFWLLGSLPAQADPAGELDLSTWQLMPSFHDGRMMPVNTFARAVVETVCDRANPRLSLEGAALEDGSDPPGLDRARALFPDGGPRKFSAAELLLSWLVEPSRWQDVPFLSAEYDELREKVLGLPVIIEHADGSRTRLKYVSPRQVAESRGFHEYIREMSEREDAVRKRGKKPSPTALDKRVHDLADAYTLFQAVTYNPHDPEANRNRFLSKLAGAIRTWREIGPDLKRFVQSDQVQGGAELASQADEAVSGLVALAGEGAMPLAKAEPQVVQFRRSAEGLATRFARYRDRMYEVQPPALNEEQVKQFRTMMHTIASMTHDLADQTREAHLALYDSGHALRLVPALDPSALEKNREPQDDAQPWIDIKTLIAGSNALLEGYPPELVEDVRESFREVAGAYRNRGNPQRPEQFAAAMNGFAAAVRALGEAVEPVRRDLPVREADDALLAATAYPPPGSTAREVHYYKMDPFKWSWIVGAMALASFGLSFGVLRKPMFWLGIVVLVAAQALTIYGLGLRVSITGWAPVTNMFETVIFVALVVGLLGLWFAVVPLVWPGLRSAWRLTAVPGTPEAVQPDDELAEMFREDAWTVGGLLALLPRVAIAGAIFYVLTRVPYGSGDGYTIVRLLPRSDVGSSLPSVGSVLVWLVSMSMLLLALWLIPRAVLTLALSVLTVPYTLARKGLSRPLGQVLARKPFVLAGATVGLVTALVAYYAPGLDKDINPLMPVLRDNFWLTVHVLTITASYGAGALAWGLGVIALFFYVFGRYRDPVLPPPEAVAQGHRPAGSHHAPEALRRRPPEACVTLGTFLYKAIQVAVLLLAAGTILGGLWADVSWGRFWGWDSKEVWALVSLLIYVAVLHGRYAGLFGNFGLAVGSVIGLTSILMAWYGVNFVLGSGLHTYASGTGGWQWALLFVVTNWGLVLAAGVTYAIRSGPTAPTAHPQRTAQLHTPRAEAVEA